MKRRAKTRKRSDDIRDIIYTTQRRYEQYVSHLRRDRKVTDTNKTLFLDFCQSCIGQGLTKQRVMIYLRWLRVMGQQTKKTFDTSMTKRDLEQVLARIRETKDYAPWSVEGIKVTAKKYFRWIHDLTSQDPAPLVVRWIRGSKPPTTLRKQDLLSANEVRQLLSSTTNTMHKALVSTAYWGALRPGEALTMRIGNVVFGDTEVTVKIAGRMERKQGSREVPLYEPYNALRSWLELHPKRDDPSAHVWFVTKHHKNRVPGPCPESNCNLSKCAFGKPLSLRFYEHLTGDLAVRSGIRKRVYPYLFRHSRARDLYLQLGEALAKKFMGHSPDSKMAAVYSHLIDDDVRDAFRKMRGIGPATQEQNNQSSCPRCSHPNDFRSVLCSRCGSAMSISAGVQVMVRREEAKEQADTMKRFLDFMQSHPTLGKVLSDPDVLDHFIEKEARRRAAKKLEKDEKQNDTA